MSGNTYPVLVDNSGTYDANGGLELLEPLYMLDGQFSESGREGRLIRGLQETKDTPVKGTSRGIGIDPSQALVVTNIYTNPIGTVFFKKTTNERRRMLCL